jgi:hypothetical protein
VKLLSGQAFSGLDAALQSLLAEYYEFAASPFGEAGGAHCKQHLVSST